LKLFCYLFSKLLGGFWKCFKRFIF
jgi:hypothetical protein